jgi:hypothetical protein
MLMPLTVSVGCAVPFSPPTPYLSTRTFGHVSHMQASEIQHRDSGSHRITVSFSGSAETVPLLRSQFNKFGFELPRLLPHGRTCSKPRSEHMYECG